MAQTQKDILADVPRVRLHLALGLKPGVDARAAVKQLQELKADEHTVLGIGEPLVAAVGKSVPGLRSFPALERGSVVFPSTQGALWLALGGDDFGEALHRARRLRVRLDELFAVQEEVSGFRHDIGRDLSGYEDGTENPKGERAVQVAMIAGKGAGLEGGSFVAVQKWVHNLVKLESMSQRERDCVVGRDQQSNEELADAPASAHVKRAAQESFEPPAFMVRKSMPWGDSSSHGLYFVAYGATLDAFERVLRRMAGFDDDIVDGVTSFSRAVSGGYYFCPPVRDGGYDFRALGF